MPSCKRPSFLLPACAILAVLCLAGIMPSISLAQYPLGLESLETMEDWPIYRQGVISRQVSSYDQAGGDNDGNGFLYQDGTRIVIFEQAGPGCVYRLWIRNTPQAGDRYISFYFDYETTPRIRLTIEDLFSGGDYPFLAPVVSNYNYSSGGNYFYFPLQFEKHLKITIQGSVEPYQIQYHVYPPGTEVTTYTGSEDPATVVAQWLAAGNDPKDPAGNVTESGSVTLSPGGTESIFTRSGAGSIAALHFTPDPLTLSVLQNLQLRFYWDGNPTPQVECNFGSFFANTLGSNEVGGLPLGVEGDDYYCYMPMPFWEDAEIELYNASLNLPVDLDYEIVYKTEEYPSTAGYFTVRESEFIAAEYGADMVLGVLTGHGQLAGFSLSLVSPYGQEALHGDLICYSDGMAMPILLGTDYDGDFNAGDYFMSGAYSLPVHGTPIFDTAGQNEITSYRFLLGDIIPFANRLEVRAEHGHSNRYDMQYSAVLYAYMRPEFSLVLTDQIDLGNAAEEAAHGYEYTLGYNIEHFFSYPGSYDDQQFQDEGHTVLESSSFTVTIDPDNEGVRLVRRKDASLFPQVAWVEVDEDSVGVWGDTDYNYYNRWGDALFEIPAAFTQGHSQVDITIHSMEATGWTEYEYWVYSHVEPIADTTPPAMVEGLDITAPENGATMRLFWDEAQDNVGIASYRIYRSRNPDIQATEEFLAGTTTLAEYLDQYLNNGTYYWYGVTAVDYSGNEGALSELVQQRTSSNYLIEGEWFGRIAFWSGDALTIENMISIGDEWSNNQQLHFWANHEDDFVSLVYQVAESDTYDVSLYVTKGPYYGYLHFQIDTTVLGGIYDLYAPMITRSERVEFGTMYLSAGPHYFLYSTPGKYYASSGYHIGIDNILLTSHYLLPVEEQKPGEMPQQFRLSQNYPNPFNASTRIEFEIPTAGEVALGVYDLLGRSVAVLREGWTLPGRYSIDWEPGQIASGIYFFKLTQDNQSQYKKALFLK